MFTTVAFTALIAGAPALADEIQWSGTTGAWDTGSNWVGGVVPSAGDTVVISSDSQNEGVFNPTISSGAKTLSGAEIGHASYGGTLEINGTGQLTILGSTDVGVGGTGLIDIKSEGVLINEGTMTLGSAAGKLGRLSLYGAGTEYTNNGVLAVGGEGRGIVLIAGGAGFTSSGAGSVVTVGEGSSFNVGGFNGVTGNLTAATAGASNLTVSTLALDGLLAINTNPGPAVELDGEITGEGTIFVAAGEVDVTGDLSGFSGSINLGESGSMAATEGLAAHLRLATGVGSDISVGAGRDANDTVVGELTLSNSAAGTSFDVAANIDGDYRSFVKDGAGTVRLTGENSFAIFTDETGDSFGALDVKAGVLQFSQHANLGSGSNGVQLSGSGPTSGTLEFVGTDDEALSQDFIFEGGAISVADAGVTLSLEGDVGGSGSLNKEGAGTLDISDANASYTGGVNVGGGSLIGSASTILGDVVNNGEVVFNQSVDGVYAGALSGNGVFAKDGSEKLTLANENDTDWQVRDGILEAQAAQFSGDVDISSGTELHLSYGGTYDGVLRGTGTFSNTLNSKLTITGDSSGFAGSTVVGTGALFVDGKLGGDVEISSTNTLGGKGSIGGTVTVHSGSLVGEQGQTLTIGEDLELSAGSKVGVALGDPEPGFNQALFDVGGDLTLDGSLHISDLDDERGNFRAGVYRIADYGGELTDNGLAIISVPQGSDAADMAIQTAVEGQVNLVNSGGQAISWWDGGLDSSKNDGILQGGDGVWRNGDANWANVDFTANAGWDSGLAIFGGQTGTVTIDGSVEAGGAVSAAGLQFITDGYVIEGDSLTLNDATDGIVSIGTDANVTATIGVTLSGDDLIDKWGGGTLILEGDSSGYGGNTQVSGGTLLVNNRLGGAVTVGGDAGGTGSLGGTGEIGGVVTVLDGSRLVGNQGNEAPLSMGGLVLEQGSIVDVTLNSPGGERGLFYVDGDVQLDGGTIEVTQGTDFGRGVYRIIDYTGSRDGDGLTVTEDGSGYAYGVQFADGDKQINLVAGSDIAFWNGEVEDPDGGVTGGSGLWRADARTNWTDQDGIDGFAWEQDLYAVFQGEDGIVTVDGSDGDISVAGMQFAVDGYTVSGDAITLNGEEGNTVIRVGDDTEDGEDYVAIVRSELTGQSRLTKTDRGTLILAGENTYDGGTTVDAGVLIIGNGGQTGSIEGDVLVESGAGFGFYRSDDFSFGGVLSGEGVVGQIGTGTTTLTNDSSGYAGTVHVTNGGLRVAGSLGGFIQVSGSGLLDGTGMVGTVSVQDGGVIGAGTSETIGDLHTGDLAFEEGSSYLVNVAADGTNDHIWSSGEVVINGGVVDARAGTGDYDAQTRYTIVTAEDGITRGGENNGFDDVTSNLAFLTPSLEYDDDNVYLVMDRNDRSFCLPGSTRNQCATGEGAESTGPGSPIYDAILNLTDPEARAALDQVSGEIHASVQGALIEDSRFVRDATSERIRTAFGPLGSRKQVLTYRPSRDLKDVDPIAEWVDAGQADGIALWTHGFGSWGKFDGDGNAAGMDRSIGGVFVGADAPVSDNMRFGVVGGYSRSSMDVDGRGSSASSTNYDLGVYGGGQWDQLGVRLGANYTWHDIDTSRSVAFPGFSDSLSADYKARTAQVYGDVGYRFDLDQLSIEPFAGLAYVNVKRDGFAENGGGAALTGQESTTDATFSTLGVRLESSFKLGEFDMTANGMLGWRHSIGDVVPTSTHAFAGGDAFTVAGAPLARNVAVIEAGVDAALNDNVSVGLSYSGHFGSGLSDQGLRGNLNWRF